MRKGIVGLLPFLFLMVAPVAAQTIAATATQKPSCPAGQVLDVQRGQDYIINVCGVGEIGLRGVEPPLSTAVLTRGMAAGGTFGGELLGDRDVGPEALTYLTGLLVGKRVTLVQDGWRVGDDSGRQYAYVYAPDKTLVNAELIRRGLGYADRRGFHPKRDEFLALEETARRAKAGVWAS
jgi:Staphylococcal nuclease homologue